MKLVHEYEGWDTVIKLHLAGYSQRDISKKMDISRHKVNAILVAGEVIKREDEENVPKTIKKIVDSKKAKKHIMKRLWRWLGG